jgi:hypothetical protein
VERKCSVAHSPPSLYDFGQTGLEGGYTGECNSLEQQRETCMSFTLVCNLTLLMAVYEPKHVFVPDFLINSVLLLLFDRCFVNSGMYT